MHKVSTRLDVGDGCAETDRRLLQSADLRYGGARVFPQSHESLMTPGRSGPRNSRRRPRRKWDRCLVLLFVPTYVHDDELLSPRRINKELGVRISNRRGAIYV